MPFQPVAATARVEMVFSLAGETVENNIYIREDNDWTLPELTGLCNAMRTWWTTEMDANLSDDITLVRVIATNLELETGPQAIVEVAPPAPGLIAGDALPNNCALCVSFRTALIGRAFRGRNYVAGISEGDATNSRIDTARAEAIRFAYNQIPNYLDPGQSHVVVTRTVNGVLQPIGLTNGVVAYVLVDNVVDSQRRRLPGRGT